MFKFSLKKLFKVHIVYFHCKVLLCYKLETKGNQTVGSFNIYKLVNVNLI